MKILRFNLAELLSNHSSVVRLKIPVHSTFMDLTYAGIGALGLYHLETEYADLKLTNQEDEASNYLVYEYYLRTLTESWQMKFSPAEEHVKSVVVQGHTKHIFRRLAKSQD